MAAPRLASQAPRWRIAPASPVMNGTRLSSANTMSRPVSAVWSRWRETVASNVRVRALESVMVSVPGGMMSAEAMINSGAMGAVAAAVPAAPGR
jgi:hypothetical protein